MVDYIVRDDFTKNQSLFPPIGYYQRNLSHTNTDIIYASNRFFGDSWPLNMKLILKKIVQNTSDIKTFVFDNNGTIGWIAGQYMRYQLPHSNPDDRGISRFFTISSAPFEKDIHLTTRITPPSSTFKQSLNNLKIGQTIEAFGPNGKFIVQDPDSPSIFIAGGIGITPYYSIIKQLHHQKAPINTTLLYANKTEDAVFKKELDKFAQISPSFRIEYFIGDNRLEISHIQRLISKSPSSTIYLSGPEQMMASLSKSLLDIGVAEESIWHDFFPGYLNI